ncbi:MULTISPECIES: hypothetical protein [Nitrosomonas]|uniref:Uncharacterized protein n=1 Tax=Nitrosomonas communis TaxID=44574 RepID=A0A5D3YAM4_9PROT|nr:MULTISPECIES: hypothetical protein [Nitrosomonas]TYP86046.1 hypothetical protein BCL69_10343 [Nitrosomonas communis]UVS61604.1 hypothetical protein NX761_00150 [Nitrosomonas sp. PLL12]
MVANGFFNKPNANMLLHGTGIEVKTNLSGQKGGNVMILPGLQLVYTYI